MKHYDYIFTGTGLSAMMTVYKMIVSENFIGKSVLLIDEDTKKTNDRTWCFWQEGPSIWESVISKKWDTALFANENFKRDLDLNPYKYNQIRSLDFYNFVLKLIKKQQNITFLNDKVTDINELDTHVFVATSTNTFTCNQLLNSIYNKGLVENQQRYPVLQQHFIGWFIKSKENVLNPEQVTFMDFSVAQKGNTRFMYALPISKKEALIEYTLFSHTLLEKQEYESEIKNYIQKLGIQDYEIVEKEQGSIPMTCFPFWKRNTKRVLNIGTAGGWTKASTGYTFKKSDKKSTQLVTFLQTQNNKPSTPIKMSSFYKKNKFWFYDLLLLDILDRNNELGSSIFSDMFQKGNPALIFKFLDEETTFIEDVKVILKCPKTPFIKALFRVIFLPKKT
ncbi:lycopene cyclase family protein [Flavobacterium branchiarum]|uniref:Lycopene cyclase family protein n=1 Tax=Flavobacterium branchiarum TaxID=1114870 RepID=A0ABV5FPG8_9FLAO|nr:lycopene cyclase family protein [Flavobacterium branchiarum]MDN3675484.1 lycopene cyclase family protein [Flavobacterium branchiarum]